MTSGRVKEFRRRIRQADRLLYDLTGTHIRTAVKKGMALATEALSRQVFEDTSAVEPMYAVLGVRPDAPDLVVKAAFRAIVREYHPDTGINPDAAKYQQAVESYRDIMLARLESEGGSQTPEDDKGINEGE